jgi:hypothetical protein
MQGVVSVRKILIVGAGQAGLQLALSLQVEGYDVTVMSARTPEEIRNGWPTSTQAMWYPALDREREYNLNLWEDIVPPILGVSAVISPEPAVSAFDFYAKWDKPGNSVDQRVKMPAWLELFEQRGGRVIYHPVMTSDLAGLAGMYDLTLIAAGKGEIVELFDRDAEKSAGFTRPGRHLSAIYLHGVADPVANPDPRLRANFRPGDGELFYMPSLTNSGPCGIYLLEANPGSKFDLFSDRPGPDEHLRRLKALTAEHFPWEAELLANAELTDARASLVGAFTTTIRKPYAEVAPGSYVLGLADVVVVNDPISGQGANNASISASMYLKAILDRGDKPFTPEWMQQVFDTYWAHAQNSIILTGLFLEPLPPHGVDILVAASQYPQVAKDVVDWYPFPGTLHDYAVDPQRTADYLAAVAARG